MIFVDGENNNMSENKQIEELAAMIHTHLRSGAMSRALASLLYKEGWRKQNEEEWIEETEYYSDDYSECNTRKVFACSRCGRTKTRKQPYCNCGAKMKGE